MSATRRLALFDFDGTITTRDSFLLFLRHLDGAWAFGRRFARLAPRVAAYLAGRYPNHRLKEDALHLFLRHRRRAEVEEAAARFCRDVLPGVVRPAALAAIEGHRNAGDEIVVVSASLEVSLAPWCRKQDVALLATRLEEDEQGFTGRILGANCWGKEKARRIRARYDLARYHEIVAYGDSRGDEAMFALADRVHYRPFRAG